MPDDISWCVDLVQVPQRRSTGRRHKSRGQRWTLDIEFEEVWDGWWRAGWDGDGSFVIGPLDWKAKSFHIDEYEVTLENAAWHAGIKVFCISY